MMPNNICRNESMAILGLWVASFPAHADNAQALVAAADAALYAAKAGGRNRISRYEPAPGQAAAQE